MNKAQKQKVQREFEKTKKKRVSILVETCNSCGVSQFIQNALIKMFTYSMDLAFNHVRDELEDQERELVGRIESKEFYDLMQIYRHTPLVEQELVVMAFENVKKFITKNENKR